MNSLVELEPSLRTCVTCHHFGPTNPTHMAPSLSNILQRDVASDNFDKYSAGLKSHTGKWTETTIASFLKDPVAFAAGTGMPNLKLSEKEIQDIVHALQN